MLGESGNILLTWDYWRKGDVWVNSQSEPPRYLYYIHDYGFLVRGTKTLLLRFNWDIS